MAQIGFLYLVDIDAVVSYLAVGDIVEAVDKICYRRLARARSSDKCHLLSGFGIYRYVVQHVLAFFVGKINVNKANVPAQASVCQ